MVNPCLPDSQNRTLHNCAHGQCVRPTVVLQYSGREVSQHECNCDIGYSGPECAILVIFLKLSINILGKTCQICNLRFYSGTDCCVVCSFVYIW